MAAPPALISCHAGNPAYAAAAVAAGWLYGARLPGHVSQPLWLADQDWKSPDRAAYMAALARHRPAVATVLDLERDDQLAEVLSWATEAAQHVREAVLIVPKAVGIVPSLPRSVGGRRVVLAYSVRTSYGSCPLPLWEFDGWPVHLLGGSPHEQMRLWRYFSCWSEVVSCDGNMAAGQSRKGRFWCSMRGPKGHWRQLAETGDATSGDGADLRAFRLSLAEIRLAWGRLTATGPPFPPTPPPATASPGG